jgi:hypothetical protein
MQTVAHSAQQIREARSRHSLVYGTTYPIFCLAEGLRRVMDRLMTTPETPTASARSVFAEARENAQIALSYAFMARKTLKQFGRDDRAKRLS